MANPENIKNPIGRPKGSKDRIQTRVKEAIEMAFDELGGVAYLVEMGRAEPKAFLSLLGKIVPREIKAEIDGDGFMKVIMAQLYGDKPLIIEHEDEERLQ